MSPHSAASTDADTPDRRTAGIVAFSRQRRQDSREKILAAVLSLISERGYHDVSVEDILAAAEISRPTFYRHFVGKADVAAELYRQLVAVGMPRRLAIRDLDYRNADIVAAWIRSLFDADRSEQRLHQVFTQALVESPDLVESAHETMREMIEGLGERIPAFRLDPSVRDERRRWLQAYLLLFEILDQSSHATLGSGVADDPLIVDILVERFVNFVG